jgi:hypothetical protein
MIRWFFGHWEIWLGIAALVVARMLGAYFSKIGVGAAQKNKARVYVLRTPDGRKKKILIKPNEDLESKMRLAVAEDQAGRARAN